MPPTTVIRTIMRSLTGIRRVRTRRNRYSMRAMEIACANADEKNISARRNYAGRSG